MRNRLSLYHHEYEARQRSHELKFKTAVSKARAANDVFGRPANDIEAESAPLQRKDYKEILAALEASPNASAVARQLGKSHDVVTKVAHVAKIELTASIKARGNRKPRLMESKRQEVIDMLRYCADVLKIIPSCRQIARLVGGVSDKTVGRIAGKENIATAGHCNRPSDLPAANNG